MTTAEIDVPHALVRVLEEAGIEFVFGMPGGDTGRIFDALYDSSSIRTILVRHEQTGSLMAEMYGRLTGKPGVVMGQGIFLACNALFGPLEAVKGASPMLVLGDFTDMAPFMHHAPYQAGTGEHGNHDLRNLFASVTKYTAAVSEPKQAVQTLQLAIKHATSGSPGPVAVVFSSRSLAGTVKAHRPPRLLSTARYLQHGVTRPAATDVARVAETLLRAGSPVIIAGNGVHASRAWAPLARVAEAAGIPVATTATGKSAMAEIHPLALGVFGNWGQAVANEVVSNADVVLVIGSRLSPTDTCFENPELLDADRQTFVQIDVEPLQIGRHYPVSAAIIADAGEALEALSAEIERVVGGKKSAPVILYCNGPFCGKSKRVSEDLLAAGFTNVRRYQLGVPVWRALGGLTQIEADGIQYVFKNDHTAVWLDTRTLQDFKKASLPGAKSIGVEVTQGGKDNPAMQQAKNDGTLPINDHNTRIVVFGDDPKLVRAISDAIAKEAFHNVAFYAGTYAEFSHATR